MKAGYATVNLIIFLGSITDQAKLSSLGNGFCVTNFWLKFQLEQDLFRGAVYG